MRDIRRERAKGVVRDHLAAVLYGASTMGLTDRLVRSGFALDEAQEVIADMRAGGEIALQGGHWVLPMPAEETTRRPVPLGDQSAG